MSSTLSTNPGIKLSRLAQLLEVELDGDGECEINGLGSLADAGPGQMSFLSNPAYATQLAATRASAVIVDEKSRDDCPVNKLISSHPYVSFARASAIFHVAEKPRAAIHPSAVIDPEARVGSSVSAGPNSIIEAGAEIGANTIIGPGCIVGAGCELGESCHLRRAVVLYPGVRLGRNVRIDANSVIGADGFGYAFDGEKSIKIHHGGSVLIEDDVEIGAGSTIDRGAMADTVIGRGVKIDNQVQIGHNCVIGEHTIICGCAAIAGSVEIGKYCIMGGASGAVGHISIADRVEVGAMSLVSRSITEPGRYSSGTGHMKTSRWKRVITRFQELDEMAKRLKNLEKLVKEY